MELTTDILEAVATRPIQRGDTGPAVTCLQNLLASVTPDGIFGSDTESAVLNFQRARGLRPDGLVGPLTAGALLTPVPPGDSDLHAVARLVNFSGRGRYVLGAGGKNPTSTTPFTWNGAQYGSDCIGAVMWALGCPRRHPDFPEYGGDINTDSALMDAMGYLGGKCLGKFFRVTERGGVHPGTIVIYRSVWEGEFDGRGPEKGVMKRMGHVGLVVGWDGIGDDPSKPEASWTGDPGSLVTAECRASWPAVRVGRNTSFLGTRGTVNSVTNPEWRVHFLEFVGPR